MLTLKDGRRFLHTPQDDADTYYFNWVTQAKKAVLISDYSFNFPKFKTVIPALLDAGLTVKLVLDSSQGGGATEKPLIIFLQALLDKYPDTFNMVLGTSPLHKINHDKFTVRDTTEVSYGSWNYTSAASLENNNLIFDPTASVVKWYTNIWQTEYDWIDQNEPQNMYNLGLLGTIEDVNKERVIMTLKLSPITSDQWYKVGKAAAYSFASSVLGSLIALGVTNIGFNKAALLAIVIPALNTALVTIKQAFTISDN